MPGILHTRRNDGRSPCAAYRLDYEWSKEIEQCVLIWVDTMPMVQPKESFPSTLRVVHQRIFQLDRGDVSLRSFKSELEVLNSSCSLSLTQITFAGKKSCEVLIVFDR